MFNFKEELSRYQPILEIDQIEASLHTSEMQDLLGMCDRIYVMSEGRLAGELSAEEATQERIMASIMQEQNKK